MSHLVRLHEVRWPRAFLLIPCLLGFAAAGCAGPAPQLDPAADVRAALDLGTAVAFREEGDPVDAWTHDSGAPEALGLRAALERAVLHSPELQQALAAVQVATADADAARLWANPLVSFVVRWGGGSPQVETSLTESVVQVLQTPTRSRAADHRLRAAAAAVLTAALDVAAELQQRYAQAQGAVELVPELEARAALLARLRAVAESRMRNGEATPAEVDALRAEELELAVELDAARSRRALAFVALAHRMGAPSSGATWTLERLEPQPASGQTESEWVAASLASRPELRQLAWELSALGEDVSLARFAPWADAEVGVDSQKDPDWATGPGVSLPLPVFDTGAAGMRRARAEVVAARHRYTEVARQVVLEVRSAHAELAAQQDRFRAVTDALLPLQQRRLQQTETAWRAGQLDVTAVLLAEQDWRAARAQSLDAARELRLARVRLERAVGGAHASAATPTEVPPSPVVTPAKTEDR